MKHDVRMTVNSGFFVDDHGRNRILRGCTLSGDAKIPVCPDGRTHNQESLNEKKAVSFTGRPFPEEEADAHFLRLQSCGFTLLRWVITWEAVEHDGPEEYDENYLAYLRNLIKKAEEYGFYVILDPCMNAFSRWTGGCGAPAWILEKIGIDLTKLDTAGAVYTHSAYMTDPNRAETYDWRVNYQLYACRTLFTLFYGGHTYAPGLMIDGDPVQDYLQEHFINAMNHTARRLKDCDAIIGFSLPSNTSAGYIGLSDVQNQIDSPCADIWLEGFQCPWKTAVLQNPDYFTTRKGEPVHFFNDFLKPFQLFFIETLQKKHSHYLFLVDDTADTNDCDYTHEDSEIREHIVQKFSLYEPSARQFTIEEAAASRKAGITPIVSSVPASFDTKSNLLSNLLKSLKIPSLEAKDKARHEDMLGQLYSAFDDSLLSAAIWNYTATNDTEYGDGWNGENNSIYDGENKQLRAQKGYCRPYAIATQGKPVKMHFDISNPDSPVFTFEWDSTICPTASGDSDTELFIPSVWFPKGWKVEKFDGVGQLREFSEQQRLYIKTLEERRCSVRIISL